MTLSLSSSNVLALDTSSKAATAFSSKKDVLSEKHGGRSETHKSVVSIGSDLLDIIRRRTIDPQTFEPGSDISWSTASVGLSVGEGLEGNETDFDFPTKSRSFEEHKDDNSLNQGTGEEQATLLDIQDALENLDEASMNPDRSVSVGQPEAKQNENNGGLTKLETNKFGLSVTMTPNDDVVKPSPTTNNKDGTDLEKASLCETGDKDSEVGSVV